MNCENQAVIAKVNSSKDNMKSSRHVKRRLKSVGKIKNSRVIASLSFTFGWEFTVLNELDFNKVPVQKGNCLDS